MVAHAWGVQGHGRLALEKPQTYRTSLRYLAQRDGERIDDARGSYRRAILNQQFRDKEITCN